MGSHKNKKKPSGQKTQPGAKKPVQTGAKAQNGKITQESKKGKKKIFWISLVSCASVALIVILAIVLVRTKGLEIEYYTFRRDL